MQREALAVQNSGYRSRTCSRCPDDCQSAALISKSDPTLSKAKARPDWTSRGGVTPSSGAHVEDIAQDNASVNRLALFCRSAGADQFQGHKMSEQFPRRFCIPGGQSADGLGDDEVRDIRSPEARGNGHGEKPARGQTGDLVRIVTCRRRSQAIKCSQDVGLPRQATGTGRNRSAVDTTIKQTLLHSSQSYVTAWCICHSDTERTPTAQAYRKDATDQDDMAVSLDRLLNFAVECCNRIFQHWRAPLASLVHSPQHSARVPSIHQCPQSGLQSPDGPHQSH